MTIASGKILIAAFAFSLAAGANADGQSLAEKKACFACHQVGQKSIGPSFRRIAKQYGDNAKAADYLKAKIKSGGVGVWSDILMPPNPHLNDAELDEIVRWILSL